MHTHVCSLLANWDARKSLHLPSSDCSAETRESLTMPSVTDTIFYDTTLTFRRFDDWLVGNFGEKITVGERLQVAASLTMSAQISALTDSLPDIDLSKIEQSLSEIGTNINT